MHELLSSSSAPEALEVKCGSIMNIIGSKTIMKTTERNQNFHREFKTHQKIVNIHPNKRQVGSQIIVIKDKL